MIMLPALFQRALPVLKKLEDAGYQAYFVGGSVRDLLLNRKTNDIDIATSALPQQVKAVFPKTIDVGIEHGTVVAIYNQIPYEITTFRSEDDYKDHRRPDSVTFITSLKEDLQRRDFTINAMAMDSSGEIHDPFLGREDLNAMVIRTVGDADERFKEDALRMMRAVRFMAQLNFNINIDTFNSIMNNRKTLQYIAVERLSAEFEKVLGAPYKRSSFKVMEETGLHESLPQIKGEVVRAAADMLVDHLTNEQMWLLLNHLSQNGPDFLEPWRLPSKKVKYISRTLSFLSDRMEKEWTPYSIYLAGMPAAIDVERVYQVLNSSVGKADDSYLRDMHDSLPIKKRDELDLSGNDLMKWTGKAGGAWIKDLIEKTERAVIQREVPNEKSTIREWLGLCNHQ
ncbi:CCA tRNA nucleotidyltransferase [Rossellomorea vietnamensis]|uniref:CCA-adding enzyme n=1 Tax=Rossellomorea vietnamensis TaxID=218284 RepID=A0A5D4NZ66_9BACI|nr:CCA tRNA nucleotidyltransferase [Rossellomorea vietnamensis]TYS19149.1 CCA tRNA nucleotidyltransferase [Rossellomorea vietnamensis]